MIWRGQFFSPTGYAQAARQYVLALHGLGVRIGIAPVDGHDLDTGSAFSADGRLQALLARGPATEGICVHHMMPPDFAPSPRAPANVGYTVFETDRLPSSWPARCNEMDEVWVPSRFCVSRFAESGVRESKLHAIPHGVDVDRYHPAVDPVHLSGVTGFVFLSLFYWCRRKGWDVLLRAYVNEFSEQEEVSLVIRAAGLDYGELTTFLDQERRTRRPRILLVPFSVPDEMMPSLYTAADAFVVPTRGEGWGMPYAEAMACGRPIIATRWGGQLEYMNDENAFLIDVETMSVIDEWMQWATGAEPDHLWAEPSVDHLRQLMRWVFEHPAEAQARGDVACRQMRESYTWRHAAQRICARLEALGEFRVERPRDGGRPSAQEAPLT